MKKTIAAVALVTLIVSPAFLRSTVHHRVATATPNEVAPRGAVSNGDAAIQLEERKDVQSGYE
jgi:peptidoglycan hydrolase CwlO-like protein